MNQPMTRPAYLNTNLPSLSERAVQGMGSVLPAHISIRGNQFTLVDAAGNKRPHGPTLDFLVADIADHVCKMFYQNPDWTPDSNDPPDCWSANGVGPSREAINPQSPTCAACPQNVRGSRISKMGSVVKACRDEVWMAIILPQYAGMIFQLRITPGSFQNWRKYVEEVKNLRVDPSVAEDVGTVLTQAVFDTEQSGVLRFKAAAYPDQATWAAREKALAGKATDGFVGRNDRPREGTAAIVQQQTPGMTNQQTARLEHRLDNPVETVTQTTTGHPFGAQGAVPAQPEQPAQQKRKRRTQAEIAADNAAQTQPAQPTMAPFRPTAPVAPNGQGTSFGISPNAPSPTAEIEQSLANVFGAPSKPAGGFGA